MQPEKRKKKLVIVFIGMNIIVQYQRKKNDNHSHGRGKKSLAKFQKTGSAVNVIVKPSDVIIQNPECGYKQKSKKVPACKFDGDVDTKPLRFNNSFSVYKKHRPANGCS